MHFGFGYSLTCQLHFGGLEMQTFENQFQCASLKKYIVICVNYKIEFLIIVTICQAY